MSRQPDWASIGAVVLLLAAVAVFLLSGCARNEPPAKSIGYLRCSDPAITAVLEQAAEFDGRVVHRPHTLEAAVPQAWAIGKLSQWTGFDLSTATYASDGTAVSMTAGWPESTDKWLASATRESLAPIVKVGERKLYPLPLVRRYFTDARAVVALTVVERMHSQGCVVFSVRVPL